MNFTHDTNTEIKVSEKYVNVKLICFVYMYIRISMLKL